MELADRNPETGGISVQVMVGLVIVIAVALAVTGWATGIISFEINKQEQQDALIRRPYRSTCVEDSRRDEQPILNLDLELFSQHGSGYSPYDYYDFNVDRLEESRFSADFNHDGDIEDTFQRIDRARGASFSVLEGGVFLTTNAVVSPVHPSMIVIIERGLAAKSDQAALESLKVYNNCWGVEIIG